MTWYHPSLAQRTIDAGDRIIDNLKAENARLRAALLNIQSMAERGNPIDNAKLAAQARHALSQQETPR
jgi:hypothetical protein